MFDRSHPIEVLRNISSGVRPLISKAHSKKLVRLLGLVGLTARPKLTEEIAEFFYTSKESTKIAAGSALLRAFRNLATLSRISGKWSWYNSPTRSPKGNG
jgi:hypothetical protein